MKKYVMSLVLSFVVLATVSAQNTKKDTVVLSVYNNNQRFMLYPMPFGKNKPDKNFVAEMVLSLDTINVLQIGTQRDTANKFPKRWVTRRQCAKIPKNVKDKVALLDINSTCDISTQVYNAQEAGALAVIVVHTTNRTDSVTLPKLTGQQRYVDANKVKIPCFTVRQVIGTKLKGMLPSLVGIRRPDSTVVVQNLTQFVPNDSIRAAIQAKQDSTARAEYAQYIANQAFTRIGWELAPNPVHDEAVLVYNFEKSGNFTVEVFNESGQLVTNYQLPDTKTGKLTLNVTAWQNGIYNVSLSNGGFRQNKRLIVTH